MAEMKIKTTSDTTNPAYGKLIAKINTETVTQITDFQSHFPIPFSGAVDFNDPNKTNRPKSPKSTPNQKGK